MEQNPAFEADIFSTNQEILHVLWKEKTLHRDLPSNCQFLQ